MGDDGDDDDWIRVSVPGHLPLAAPGRCYEVAVGLCAYDRDLGMPTAAAVRRQLRVDLPRSRVSVDGVRTQDPERVLRATFFPRLCTQASVAPVVEWLLRTGGVAHELPDAAPLEARITHGGDRLVVRKCVGLRTWDGTEFGAWRLGLDADVARHSLVASVVFVS